MSNTICRLAHKLRMILSSGLQWFITCLKVRNWFVLVLSSN